MYRQERRQEDPCVRANNFRMWGAERLAGIAAAVMIAGVATPALAAPHADSPTTTVEATLSGHITPSCQLSGGGEIDFGQLTGGETAAASFGLGCNVPFDIGFQSARGGLAHAALPQGQGPFAGTLGYTLSVIVPTLLPQGAATLNGSFTSQELVARKTLSSGDAIAAGGGQIRIRTSPTHGAGLLAGEYSETLSITVTPRV